MTAGGLHNAVVVAAARLARRLHRGQKDKAGKDYFEAHLCAVAAMGRDWKEQTVGYLHDAAEDTPCTVDEIMGMLRAVCHGPTAGEWREIAVALSLLNSRTAASRRDYIERFRGHGLAIRVKLNDLRHNMDITRIPEPSENDRMRVARYREEFRRLEDMLSECGP